MLRAWIIDGQLQIALSAWVWEDEPEEWGRLLAEAAGHLADAISKETGRNRDKVFSVVHESVVANLEDLPDTLTGDFVDRPQ